MIPIFELKRLNDTLVIIKNKIEINRLIFKSIIQQIIVCELGYAIILTDPSGIDEGQENLFYLDFETGNIKWSKSANKSRSKNNIFTHIQLETQKYRLTAWDWDGYRYIIDCATGVELESHFFK